VYKVIEEFLAYLGCFNDQMELCSASTFVGLKVTCSVALELSNYLIEMHLYDFVMLTRLNQDNLEVG